jgi:hypothetical protein
MKNIIRIGDKNSGNGTVQSGSTVMKFGGIEEPLRSWLIGAGGLTGQAARDHLNAASSDIRKHTFSRKQQHDLFIPTYDYMRKRIIEISNSQANIEDYGRLTWDNLSRKLQDIAVDLIYRGDYTSTSRRYF